MDDQSKLSVDHMVEMAMGLSMASLFSQALNSAFANSTAQQQAPLNTPAKYIYAILDGKQQGPFSPGEIVAFIQSGHLTRETYMWKPGMPEWKLAKDITDIGPVADAFPPATPQNTKP